MMVCDCLPGRCVDDGMTVSHALYCASIIAMHVLSVCNSHSHADGSSKVQLVVTWLSVYDLSSRAQPAVCQKLKLGGKVRRGRRGGREEGA